MKPRTSSRRKPDGDTRLSELAQRLHDDLGQHLVGVTLETGALARKLDDRQAPELREARLIMEHLRSANLEVSRLIAWLDRGSPR